MYRSGLLISGAAVLSVFAALSVNATELLSGQSVRSIVAGKTVYISTPVGSVPIVYRTNGTMTARAHILATYTGRSSDEGLWWVARDQICQRWRIWLSGNTHCYRFRKSGRKVLWHGNDGTSGTATVSK